jgi:asparagine synthase (glutamine-hydrolysing)
MAAETSEVVVHPGHSSAAGTIGDLLLLFGECHVGPFSRSPDAAWQPLERADGWCLLMQQATATWAGYPHLHIRDAMRPVWLLGELYGEARQNSTRWIREVTAGARSAADLNGHFLLVAYDPVAGEWHLWTDRFGTVHAYHAWSGRAAAIGTFAPTVSAIASKKELDWEALTAFSAFGFFPSDRTHFTDVRIFKPACHYVTDRRGKIIRVSRYWDWRHESDRSRSYTDTLAEFAHTLDDVLDDLTATGRIAVPISGGLDSRTTVATLTRTAAVPSNEGRLWAYSYGYTSQSVETQIAERIAHARRLPFSSFEVPPYLFDQLDVVQASLEGFQDITQARQASIIEELATRADRVVAAHWGDVWLDDMKVSARGPGRLSDRAMVEHTFSRIQKPGHEWLLRNLCEPRLKGSNARDVLHDFLHDGLGELADIEDQDFVIKAFKTDQWSFRWTLASLRMYQAGALPLLPFYDTRLTDFFCTVPTEMVAARRLQADYLRRFAPDLAKIEWEARGLNLYRLGRPAPDAYLRKAAQKAIRLITRRRPIQRNWEVQFLSDGGPRALRQALGTPGQRLHELVAPAAVDQLLTAFFGNPDREAGFAVSQLLTFSTWLERYA